MLALIYDTETTGLPDWKQPSEAPHQPHIVELAALLYDTDTCELVDSMHTLVCPDGWKIPDDVAAIHGITTERAAAEGIHEAEALAMFLALHRRADRRVAHSESFDARLLRIAMKRFGDGNQDVVTDDPLTTRIWHLYTQEEKDTFADAFKAAPSTCTMWEAKKACPGVWRKVPTLGEAHLHLVGQPLEEVHRALPDAEACARVYFALQARAKVAA